MILIMLIAVLMLQQPIIITYNQHDAGTAIIREGKMEVFADRRVIFDFILYVAGETVKQSVDFMLPQWQHDKPNYIALRLKDNMPPTNKDQYWEIRFKPPVDKDYKELSWHCGIPLRISIGLITIK